MDCPSFASPAVAMGGLEKVGGNIGGVTWQAKAEDSTYLTHLKPRHRRDRYLVAILVRLGGVKLETGATRARGAAGY